MSPELITLHKSLGVAVQDDAAATRRSGPPCATWPSAPAQSRLLAAPGHRTTRVPCCVRQ